ncbi:MAG: phage tail protein [Verrucomicrobia bacterium]|nr:phage tail protein [Verrucomicrobiota bacterium]
MGFIESIVSRLKRDREARVAAVAAVQAATPGWPKVMRGPPLPSRAKQSSDDAATRATEAQARMGQRVRGVERSARRLEDDLASAPMELSPQVGGARSSDEGDFYRTQRSLWPSAGMMFHWDGDPAAIPDGTLRRDGASYAAADYPRLWRVIGNKHGGDAYEDETGLHGNFNVPDASGRVDAGLDEEDPDFDEVGKKAGEKDHTHIGSVSGDGSHSHTIAAGALDHYHGIPDHTHSGDSSYWGNSDSGSAIVYWDPINGLSTVLNAQTSGATFSGSLAVDGGTHSHNVSIIEAKHLPPYIVGVPVITT